MGGAEEHFQKTPWSLVYSARTQHDTRRRLLLEELSKTYWKPVYCYVRKKGYANEAAKDLTQSFFCEIVLGRDLLRSADPTKGRLRTFLLVALERYLASSLRHASRLKRGSQAVHVPLDGSDQAAFDVPDSLPNPDQAFYYAWITELLDHVLAEVKQEYCGTGRQQHWEVFRLRLLEPILHNAVPLGLPEICQSIGVKNPAKASNMIETVKRRFRAVLKRHLRNLVSSDEEAEEEFREIMTYLSQQGAR